jgi:hypothetical protein
MKAPSKRFRAKRKLVRVAKTRQDKTLDARWRINKNRQREAWRVRTQISSGLCRTILHNSSIVNSALRMRMSDPRGFYESIVKPAYEAWLADPLQEWKAKAATSNADILAERLFLYWKDLDRLKVFGAISVAEYRTHLRQNMCQDFGLVWDIRDGHKHMKLNRQNRELTNAAQTGVGRIGFGDGAFGEGVLGGGPQIVVELDDGTRRALSGVMKNVMAMWDTLLKQMAL